MIVRCRQPGDPSDWDVVVVMLSNNSFLLFLDKQFPANQEIAFLSRKTIAMWSSGFGQSSGTQQLASSGTQQVPMPMSLPNEEGLNDASSYSPTPTPLKSGNLYASNASAHTSSNKRHRSSPLSCKTIPT
uniref:Uncharacterized protein n=1 Tax=Ananas comosus var. bracteatus TaxID=296719 RepID=A0A6V7PSM3_ANACO|nr:unnamed protein product [Ananas comosus var. bracteatus]